MPIKTQMRLSQITGSFAAVGDSRSIITTAPASTIATMSEADLSGSLSHIASALGRIHGKASGEAFNNAPGEFYQAIKVIDAGGLTLGAGGNEFSITESSDDVSIKSLVSDKDMIFKVNDGGADTEVFRLDGDVSALLMASGKAIQFADAGESISGDGNDLTIASGRDIILNPTGKARVTQGQDLSFAADDAEKITGNGDDLILTAGTAVNIVAGTLDMVAQAIDVDLIDNNANAISFDAAGQASILKIDTQNGAEKVIAHAMDVSNAFNALGDVVITGDLTVNGTTTQLDVTNLNVEDPFILMGGKATAANSNTGLIFMSGSSTGAARPDITFARGGNDVWHLGSIASNSGSITSATAATMDIAFKAGEIQIFEAATRLKQTSNSLHIESDESILLDAKSAGAIEYKFGGQTKGLVKLASNDLIVSSSVAALSLRSATGGVELFDTHDGGNNARQVAKLSFDAAVTNGAALELGTATYGGIIKTIGGKNLSLAQTAAGYLELGVDDNAGNGYLALSGSGTNVTLNVGAGDGADGFVAKEGKLSISGSALVLDNGAGDTAQLQFKSNNANYIRLQPPTSVGTTYTLTLPPTAGNADQVLKTNGSGVLDWVNQPVAGSAAAIKRVGTLAALVAKDTAVNFNTGGTFVENAVQLDVGAVDAVARINAIDVYVNGQLLSSGTSAPGVNVAGGDYVLVDNGASGAGSPGQATLKFAFSLEADDVLSVIIRG